ncbi:hypothetical protein SAMN05192573_10621 [Mucilaginibacter gossypii]|uniref:Uncharacterized protein n=1 Tax=Mucilaginibacter gossypii TaxID=551996 RepID=A0A1G7YQH4_9SPHI|nr:hypothetical protein SAMN05192573_10621 [Mucilaginibacter gossypii]
MHWSVSAFSTNSVLECVSTNSFLSLVKVGATPNEPIPAVANIINNKSPQSLVNFLSFFISISENKLQALPSLGFVPK